MKRLFGRLPLWLIPIVYAAVTFVAAMTLPRFEHVFFEILCQRTFNLPRHSRFLQPPLPA